MEEIIVNIITALIMFAPIVLIATAIIILVKRYRKKHPKKPKVKEIPKEYTAPPKYDVPPEEALQHRELTKEEKKVIKRQYKEEDFENSPVRMVEHHISHKEYWYHVHGLNHPNEEGEDIHAILEEVTAIKYDTYPGTLKVVQYEGKPAVKVYIYDGNRMRHIGWIPAQKAESVADMFRKHDCTISLDVHKDGDAVFVEALIEY